MAEYIIIAGLTLSIIGLIDMLLQYRGIEQKYRRACGELRSADALIATANRQRDDSRREMERYKDLNAKYLREMNARKVA